MKFEMSLPFLSKTNKNLNILRTKKAFDVKGFQLAKIASDLRVRL